ncbi:MAG: hypothetical protein JOY65_01580 [Acetobacteraceae bacterium]|nr:hypothetical protein [Acetobacteraceae bacterium]
MDRLARNLDDLRRIVHTLTGNAKAEHSANTLGVDAATTQHRQRPHLLLRQRA